MTRRSINLVTLLATMAVAGCGDNNATAPAATTGASTAATGAPAAHAATHPLTVTLDGKPVLLRSALLRSFGGRTRMLTLSTASMLCTELGASREHGNEKTLNVTLAPLLGENGKEHWAITSARYERTTRRGDLGPVALSNNTVEGVIDIDLTLDLVTQVGLPGQTPIQRHWLIAGKLRAQGCGERGVNADTKIREQPNMQWTLAGKRFSARGATISYKPEGAILRLSTEPHSCATSLSGSDAVVTVHMQGPPPQVTKIALSGAVLGRDRSAMVAADAFSARLDKSPSGKGFSNVTVQGAANVLGLKLILEGVADAQVCHPAKKRP
ncbi:MAG TPA: hypothetical protein ENK23_04575 [Sorangium sp.]|nr:hypothetical protein [Sorangium sp.]